MSTNPLQTQINAKADARLRRLIDERVDHLRQEAAKLPAVLLNARDDQGTPVEVSADPVEMVNALADASFALRRDQARHQLTRDFLEKVRDAGIEI